ncbi:CDP-glycerol glycerophosphotransferase family protein [Stackebrandtia soli]|uniref:CDP-glycerol glycerophosphotransferase family protein n=1 Tax=Stackebrandtia soli TaxID=1892856 RepID=UPI0039EA3076
MIRKLLDTLIPPGLPVLALAAFALLDQQWPGYALAAIAIAYQLTTYRLDGLGHNPLGRALTVAALVTAAAADADAGAAIAGVLLVAVIAFEPRLLTALTSTTVLTANLTVRRGVKTSLSTRNVYVVSMALAIALLVVGAANVPGWPVAVAVGVGAFALGAATVLSWRGRRRHAHTADTGVQDAVTAHAPRFAIHFAAPPGSQYQLSMWLPYFDDLGDDYVIILRDKAFLPLIASLTSTPIVVAPSVADLERTLVDSIRAVFYVNNSMQNTQCVRFAHLTHVQLMHGDSDKPASYNPISAMYDRIFVAGQAGVDRYHNHGIDIPTSHFRLVGHPQASAVDVRPARTGDDVVCLYAPTWTGLSSDVNFCSLPLAERLCEAMLARGVTMIVRPHPYTRRNPAAARQLDAVERLLAADAERTGRRHLFGRRTSVDMSLIDCINAADVMVCDVSGAASDWLYSERPFAITDMTNLGDGLAAELPLAAAAYRVAADGVGLDKVCEQLLDVDPLADKRAAMKRYYLGDFPTESYRDAFADAARDCYLTPTGQGAR